MRMFQIKKSNEKIRWLLYYSISFVIACLAVYALQIFYKKSFIHERDSLLQHYTALMYYGKWLRSILSNIFIAHCFSVPDWDIGIGLGGGVVSTLHYYGVGDPLNLLAVFVPAQHTEALYHFLIILRLYLAGIAFWVYCRHHKYRNAVILPGAIIYVFSFYTIVLSVLHPFFLNPLIYFPLVLLGIDLVMEKGKPVIFIVSCVMAAYSNFYFFYMISILMVIYAVIRYLTLFRMDWDMKHLLCMLGKFSVYYLISILAALPVLLPSAQVVLTGGRTGEEAYLPVLYEPVYYLKLVIAYVNASADHYAALGYTSVGLLAVVLLFWKTGKLEKLQLKIAFILGAIFLMIPFCGHVLNGFGYATNRWVWAYGFVAALIVVDRMPQMIENAKISIWVVLAGMLVFALPTFWYRIAGNREKIIVSAVLLTCVGVGGGILAAVGKPWKSWKASVGMFMVIIFMNLFLNAFSFYSPYGGNDLEQHVKAGQAYKDRMDDVYALFDKADIDSSGLRIDTVHMGVGGAGVNSAMVHGRSGTSFYFSMNNSSTSSFIRDMELPISTDIMYTDLDARSFVEILLGCRYCVVKQGEEQYLPYGYEKMMTSVDGYAVYENEFALPLVYTYDSFMTQEEYDSLTAVKKQQALMQICVLEEDVDGLPREKAENLEFSDTRKAVVVDACSEGIRLDGNRILVSENGASLHISADVAECTERYLEFQNLWYYGSAPNSTVTITDGQTQVGFQVRSPSDGQYTGVHDLMCNLGYREEHGAEYTITFGASGEYTCDNMEIVDQPVDSLEHMAGERRQDLIQYTVGEDIIEIGVQMDNPGIVYVAMPYHKKWKAYVDGSRAVCRRANGFGIGVCVEEGNHQIELRYE